MHFEVGHGSPHVLRVRDALVEEVPDDRVHLRQPAFAASARGASEEEVAQLQAELEHEREKTKTSSMQHAALLETFEAEIATTRELLQEKEREGQRQLTAEIEAHKRTAERLAQAEATDTRRSDLPDMAVGVTHP